MQYLTATERRRLTLSCSCALIHSDGTLNIRFCFKTLTDHKLSTYARSYKNARKELIESASKNAHYVNENQCTT